MASPTSQRTHGGEPRIDAIVAGIAAAIPEAQVRMFGSRARGTAHADSDLDLLITVPDQWLASHDRVRVLGGLWRQWSSRQLPLDLLLYSESEICQRQQYRGAVTTQAYLKGILLYG
jgi:predicted nucleotidyltransferase